jgi:hypothetical protein
MAKPTNNINQNKQDDIIDFEFPNIPQNTYIPAIPNPTDILTNLEKEIKEIFVCDQNKHNKCTLLFNMLRYLLENTNDLQNVYNYNYYHRNSPDIIINNIIYNLICSSCLFHDYKYKLYVIKLLITKFYKFVNISIMPYLVSVNDFFDLYIHCIKTNMNTNNKDEFLLEINKVFKYLKILIELSDEKNKTKVADIRKNKLIQDDYNYRRRNKTQYDDYNTIYDLPAYMDKELFEKYYEKLKSVFEYINKNSEIANKYIEIGIMNDFQELINYVIDNKIELKNYYLILAFTYGSVDLAKTFILHGCKISKNTLNEVLTLLLNTNTYNYFCLKSKLIKSESFQFMIENGCEYNKELVLQFLIKYFNNNQYIVSSVKEKENMFSCIANYIFTTKDCLTLDELIKLTEYHIILNSPIKLGLDINCDKFREYCTKIDYNPYKIKEKLSLEQLQEACYSTNIAKVKKICKTIKPDIQCLRNACSNKLNKKTVEYLLESHGLELDDICLVNVLKSCHTILGNYVANKYNVQKINKPTETVKPLDYNSLSEDENIEDKEDKSTINNILDTTDKKIIKVTKTKSKQKKDINKEVNTEVNNTEINQELIKEDVVEIVEDNKKKIIREKIIKVKTDSTKSNTYNQENKDNTQNTDNIIANKTKVIKKKIIKINKDNKDNIKEETKQELKEVVIDLNTMPKLKIIPDNYNFRKLNKLNDYIKNILKLKSNEISFNDLREEILNYLNSNKLFNGDKINIKDFKLNINEIDFNSLDDFIYNLFVWGWNI